MTSLRIPTTEVTVHDFLRRNGPMTLSELSSWAGLSQDRLRTHLRLHRDAYGCSAPNSVGFRTWHVKGPIE